jgi:predicted RNA-binding protein associated with RNAse of E/G family
MEGLKLYRKRIIPAECVFLKDDFLLYRDSDVIVTRWRTLRPKKTLSHGYSCYFPERGFKVSKFYDHEDRLISWYCDIIQTDHTIEDGTDIYVFTDLLADVVVYPDGRVRVVDLDELADAQRDHLIQPDELQRALRHLDRLLKIIYKGAFDTLQKYINTAEEKDRAEHPWHPGED